MDTELIPITSYIAREHEYRFYGDDYYYDPVRERMYRKVKGELQELNRIRGMVTMSFKLRPVRSNPIAVNIKKLREQLGLDVA